MAKVTKPVMLNDTGVRIARALENIAELKDRKGRVEALENTAIASGTVVEIIGAPDYVADPATFSAYGLTEPGWYAFCRISAPEGVTVTASTTVDGADGCLAAVGEDHIDVAIMFEVAATSKKVTIDWGEFGEIIVFNATDLAIRNLDYRVTFYVYPVDNFATWEYTFTTDTTFAADKHYYTEQDGVYTEAEVTAGDPVAAYYVQVPKYSLTTDATFADGKTYYTKVDDSTYAAATVTTGEAVTADTYYELSMVYEQASGTFEEGTTYYTKQDGVYTEAEVTAGDPVAAYYVQVPKYSLTTDATFADGKTYYTKVDDSTYAAATVTTGEAVTADTYYELSMVYEQASGTFEEGTTYYTKQDGVYTEAEVTAGDPVAAYYVHSKVTFQGMTRNITYVCNTPIDCPTEFILPEIEDETHGCWFEIRFYHTGEFSSTLTTPEGVKVATEHTQPEKAGFNDVFLQYDAIAGIKAWRFLNTHSTIPA